MTVRNAAIEQSLGNITQTDRLAVGSAAFGGEGVTSMTIHRRGFLKLAGASGAGLFAGRGLIANETPTPAPRAQPAANDAFMTELFLDNQMIAESPGVSRRLHKPKKHLLNPVVRCERWCDGNDIQPYTTMYDSEDKLFKMWARSGSDWKSKRLGGHAAYMLYFTSHDGVHWDRPDLGVLTVAGRRDHNIVFTSDAVLTARASGFPERKFVVPTHPAAPQGKKAFFWGVNKHPHPRDASERFVALAIVQDHRRGAHVVTSPDGIHWACASAPFWQTPHDVSGNGDDCLMHLIYDRARQKWVVYRRIIPEFSERMIADDRDADRPPVERYNRSYARAESSDLREWTNHRFILAMDPDDPPDTELYQFGCHKIGRTYVGYMSVFYLRTPQPIDIHLATSRDGAHFTRVCRGEPFIAHGPLGYYDYMAMACSQPEPIIVNDTVYIYYAAANFPHNADTTRTDPAVVTGGAALATFKRDRYASLETSSVDPGPCRLVTKPVKVQHGKLYLNAATWSNGAIRVEALTPDWQPIAKFTEREARTIQGDALDHPVHWNDRPDVRSLVGKEIRLKFYMTRARLYALTFANENRKLGGVESESEADKPVDRVPTIN